MTNLNTTFRLLGTQTFTKVDLELLMHECREEGNLSPIQAVLYADKTLFPTVESLKGRMRDARDYGWPLVNRNIRTNKNG